MTEATWVGHLDAVRGFLVLRCRESGLAEELTQEVAARMSTRGVRLDGQGNVRSYLVRVAHNVWRDWLRRELVRRRADAQLTAEPVITPRTADSELLAAELDQALRRAIDGLPRAQREVVRLRHRGDLTFQQIADRLHRPLGTVLSQMHAALKKMQDVMEAYR